MVAEPTHPQRGDPRPLALRVFYAAKPLIPRPVQVRLRRVRAARIWKGLAGNPLPPNAPAELDYRWPHPFQSAVMVTHDVEKADGQSNIAALRDIERELGIRSCWNFVIRRYRVDTGLMADLRAEGHEVGVHGVYHDGRLFSSEEVFEERLRVMEETAAQWGASGFRSPSLLYDLRLLTTRLRFSWDSSMPAWDPFQPQPGGCLRFVPFALNDRCVELPVTLWQDFTLFEELGMSDIEVWKRQIAWLHSIGGLINVIVHPDYLRSARRLDLYRSLLIELCGLDGAWRTLPNEVADWERERAAAAPAEEDRSPASRDQPRR